MTAPPWLHVLNAHAARGGRMYHILVLSLAFTLGILAGAALAWLRVGCP
jgi:hypothetical protein